MAIRNADLSTRMGAENAAQQGALGCFVLGGLTVFGAYVSSDLFDLATLEGRIGVGLVVVWAAVCFTAGLRMLRGKGAYWAIATAGLLAATMIANIVIEFNVVWLLVWSVLMVVIVRGIRGALALRKRNAPEAEDTAAFE